jgi:hypothetical protein
VALCRIERGRPAVPRLLSVLDKDPRWRHPASVGVPLTITHAAWFANPAAALAVLGLEDRAAIPWLVRAARHPEHAYYLAAFRALERIDREAALNLWDRTGLRRDGYLPRAALTPGQLSILWSELKSVEPSTAARASWTLILAPDDALPFLKKRLRPVAPVSPERIARSIADLDSEHYAVRLKAMTELDEAQDLAETALHHVVRGRPNLETRRRAEELLERLDPARSAQRRRLLRAIQTLQRMATPQSREALAEIGKGAPNAALTREAKAALQRLDKHAASVK